MLHSSVNGGVKMSLKFERDDSLDKKLEEFAILPELEKKKEQPDIERFLNPKKKKKDGTNEKSTDL
jgi:hypothetical protein